MAYDLVHRQPLFRLYRASSCSWAYFLRVAFQMIEILLPLIIVFLTQGLWRKFGEFRETPQVAYEGKHLFLINGDTNSFILSSSFPVLNVAQQSRVVVAEEAWHWLTPTQLNLDVRLPLNNRTVESVTFIIFLRYHLDYHAVVRAQLALTSTIRSLENTQQLIITGLLKADQSQPFRGFEHEIQLMDESRQDLNHYKPANVINRIAAAGLALSLGRQSELRIPRSDDSSTFTLGLHLHVDEDHFFYRTDFWELLKWAWIQFLAVYLVVRYLSQELLTYLFANNVIESITSNKQLL